MALMTPLSAKRVHEGYGICQHVNFQANNIHAGVTNQTAMMNKYGDMSVHQMRSAYPHTNSTIINNALANCRNNDVKWNVVCATEASTQAEINARINHIANNAADVVYWIEGVNEPNAGTDWVAPTVNRQRWIWEAVRSHPELDHVIVLGPSMHDVRLDNSNGQHWQDFVNGGGDQYMEMCAVHGYPGGSTPDNNRDQRVQYVYDAFGDGYPIKFTEWGYTNALGKPKSARATGHAVIPAALSAIYDVQGVLDFANEGHQLLRYEMMDDPDGGGDENNSYVQESNFGLIEVQTIGGDPATTWTDKPAVAGLSALLGWLKDPGSDYSPTPVDITINKPSSVRTSLIQKRNGVTRLYLWRHGQIWNPNTEVPITLGNVAVSVTDAAGTYNLSVGPEVQYIEIATDGGGGDPGGETPTFTLKTSGQDTTNSATRVTASFTPSGDYTIAAIASFDITSTEIASVTGAGLTWTPLTDEVKVGNYALRLYKGTGSGSTGPVTITYTGTAANCLWAIFSLSNAGSLLASASNSVTGSTSMSVNLASAPPADSLTIGCYVVNNDSAIGAGSGYTEQVEVHGTNPTMGLQVQTDVGAQNSGISWPTSGGAAGWLISIGTGAAIPSGDAAGTWDFAGSAEGSPGASATGSHSWTATTFGSIPEKGNATGSHEWTGIASGVTPGLPKFGEAAGSWGMTATAIGETPPTTTLYTPPTHEEGIRVVSPILRYFRITVAKSLVKINGTWTQVRSPSPAMLAGLTEGVDYLKGGYIYALSAELFNEVNDLFPSGELPEDFSFLVVTFGGVEANLTDDDDNLLTV